MKKTMKLFTVLFALLFTVTGCSAITDLFGSTEAMGNMEVLNEEFTALMESEGYELEIVYKGEYDGDVYNWYSLGEGQYVERMLEAGVEDLMKCNVNGEYSGVYDGSTYAELEISEEEMIEYCDESMKFYDDEYGYMLTDLYDAAYDINYEENDDNFRAFGTYEETKEEGMTSGKYEMIISKDKKTLVYNDEVYTATITIGKKFSE